MSDVELKKVLREVFTHVGWVTNIDMDWEDDKKCQIEVTYLLWSGSPPEEITEDLLTSGALVNDDFLYFRINNKSTQAISMLQLDLGDENWQRSLAMQMGHIVVLALRKSMVTDD